MDRPVIFLDFDGPLLTSRDYGNARTATGPEESAIRLFRSARERVERLNRICEATGAVVVLSTSWRINAKPAGVNVRYLEEGGFTGTVIGATPNLARERDVIGGSVPRGWEISAWLRRHPTSRYVVIDDDLTAGEGHAGRFLECGGPGLTEERAAEAIRILTEAIRG